jgi:hypothetical protein
MKPFQGISILCFAALVGACQHGGYVSDSSHSISHGHFVQEFSLSAQSPVSHEQGVQRMRSPHPISDLEDIFLEEITSFLRADRARHPRSSMAIPFGRAAGPLARS